MNHFLFYLLVFIPFIFFVLERYLSWLNSRMWSVSLPETLKGLCDEAEYKRSQLYHKDNEKQSFISSSINLLVLLAMLCFKGFAVVDSWARLISGDNMIMVALVFFFIIGFASEIINLPLSWYDTFVIEERYGFNTTNKKTFILDFLKNGLVSILIGAPVIWIITMFYYKVGDAFWLYAWGFITVLSLFINLFYSNLIVPLFNKQTPLEQGTLREKIEAFAKKSGFDLKDIYVIDGSKRSTKSNAYFSGFGPKKRVVLYDTLMKDFSEEEIVAILAHEVGHYKGRHIIQSVISSILLNGLMLYIFSLVIDNPSFSYALGADTPSFHLGLIVFGILYTPISLIISLVTNYISRKHEFEADKFSGDNYDKTVLAEALKKLSLKNLSNMLPHPAYVFFYYSHPPLLKRLERLK